MKPEERFQLDCARARFACDAAAFALGIRADLLVPDRGTAQHAFARQVACI